MKKIASTTIIFAFCQSAFSQDPLPKLTDLAVPNSPAFILIDASPTNIESPVNPKEFTLSLIQNFNADNKWFNDYSLEFTPYWFLKPRNQSVYSFAGVKETIKNSGTYDKNNPLSGLKFTSISIALLNKDMVPDHVEENQKVFSIGFRSTLLKIRKKDYATNINSQTHAWHNQMKIIALANPGIPTQGDLDNLVANMPTVQVDSIKALIEKKPLFNLDLAGGIAQYGIGDSTWKTGRAGLWLTGSLFIPLQEQNSTDNYFDLLFSLRYLNDNYSKIEDGIISSSSVFDAGVKLGFEINRFSLFGEGMLRKANERDDWENRVVAILNYKVQENLYLSGTYGKDFGPDKKIIGLFGVNWGFGSEKLVVPKE